MSPNHQKWWGGIIYASRSMPVLSTVPILMLRGKPTNFVKYACYGRYSINMDLDLTMRGFYLLVKLVKYFFYVDIFADLMTIWLTIIWFIDLFVNSVLRRMIIDDVVKHRNIFPTLVLCILQIENTLNQIGFLQLIKFIKWFIDWLNDLFI